MDALSLPKPACDKRSLGHCLPYAMRGSIRGCYSAGPLWKHFARCIAARTEACGHVLQISCGPFLCIDQQTCQPYGSLFKLLLALPTSLTPRRQHRLQKSRVLAESQACLCLSVRQENCWPLLAGLPSLTSNRMWKQNLTTGPNLPPLVNVQHLTRQHLHVCRVEDPTL